MPAKFFRGNKKYFSFAMISVILLFLIGIISPVVLQKQKDNWNEISKNEIENIEEYIYDYLKMRMDEIIEIKTALKNKIKTAATQKDNFLKNLSLTVNRSEFDNYSLAVTDYQYNLRAWNRGLIKEYSSVKPHFNYGEIFFIDSDLMIYLGLIDTVETVKGNYFIKVGLPVEKEYKLTDEFFEKLSLKEYFSSKFHTRISIDYSEFAAPERERGKYSFQLLNNFKNKIGTVTFESPSSQSYLESTEDIFSTIQSVLAIIAILMIGIGAGLDLKKIESKFLKWMLSSVYLIGLRYALYYTGIPNKFIKGDLINPAYFSSTFAGGLVKSPLDFFISAIILFSICIIGYNYVLRYVREPGKIKIDQKFKFVLLTLSLGAFYFLALRALGASVRSIIFDSSLIYFYEQSLIPNLPVALMQSGILILGISFLTGTSVMILILLKNIPPKYSGKKYYSFILSFVFFQFAGLLFDLLQPNPQGTPLIRILFITSSFIGVYLIYHGGKKTLFNFLFFSFTGSIIMINLLSHYNSELERESIKTTALQYTLRSENWLEFVVIETLSNKEALSLAASAFENGALTNYEAMGFRIWSRSSLPKQIYSSSVRFMKKDGTYLGGFSFGSGDAAVPHPGFDFDSIKTQKIFKENILYTDYNVIRCIAPIKLNNTVAGFIEASILYDINSIANLNFPLFLKPENLFEGTVIPYEKLKIFNFINGQIKDELGGYTLNEEEKYKILSTRFTSFNEAWMELKLNNENHLFYILKDKTGGSDRIIAIALKEKDISFGLFDFFRVLFIHTIYIVIVLFIVALIRLKDFLMFRFSFRSWLLAAFLVVALIPLILLAVYLRDLTEVKNEEAVIYKLSKRASNIKEYVQSYLPGSVVTLNGLLSKAGKDLQIDFSVFKNNRVIYSSHINYFDAGLFPSVLNPEIYNELVLSGMHDLTLQEKIEKISYNSYNMKAEFGGEIYIIQVNDLFNAIQIPMSSSDTDVFLFVSYSLAVILIIILSTFLSNQISSPIRKLTVATKSVASGDLSLQIEEKTKGEIQDLVEGFNYMVKELKRSEQELAGFEREAAWKEMAKQVAHEIKNPLTPMKLAVQQLMAAYRDKSPKFDDIFEKVTNTVINQIEILKNIASEFSSFARMPNLNLKKLNLREVVYDSVNLFIEEKIKFDVHGGETDSNIYADSDQLKRTIINLIRNSIQASADSIIIQITNSEDKIFLRIKDNGKGIPQEIIDRIFEENFTTKIKGMGIGLAISKKFIESINSTIEVEETSSAGTTMLITLPKFANG